jgi:hypothetical protein
MDMSLVLAEKGATALATTTNLEICRDYSRRVLDVQAVLQLEGLELVLPSM